MTPGRIGRGFLRLVLPLALLAACGVPIQSEPEFVDPTLVPNQLLSGSTPAPTTVASPTTGKRASSYFVDGDALVTVRRADAGETRREKVRHAIQLLLQGPTKDEQAAGLSTAIATDLGMSVTSLNGGEVTIELAGPLRNSATDDLTLAVAQIVLTMTAVPGVDFVRLTQQGRTIEAPLVDGSVTAKPLSADDYRPLVRSSPPPPNQR